jgi:hypothetical protein
MENPAFAFSCLQEEQLEEWFDHLAAVFVNTPRQYFVEHHFNDPWPDLAGFLSPLFLFSDSKTTSNSSCC